MVPRDAVFYPTLGPQVVDFIEQNMIFGPGDLRGKPAIVDDEKRGWVYRMYEVFPKGHPRAGRRRFKRCAISVSKGQAKTEFAAWIAGCELHPEAPVRCVGWTPGGEPIGGPVTDPYIPMVATAEQQSEELAYLALCVILGEGPLKDDFHIGAEQIERRKGGGKAQALSTSPNARDGARTTFSVMDETHRLTRQSQLDGVNTMFNNLPKRFLADAWNMEITTAPKPGEGSVAEATMNYAKQIDAGKIVDPTLFFFHRQAAEDSDLKTVAGIRAAVIEASGPSAAWRDIDAIVSLFQDPTQDKAYLGRVWCNLLMQGSERAFDILAWRGLSRPDYVVKPGALITLGFDGSLFHDATGIIATDVETGYQWNAGVWECPPDAPRDWSVPEEEVDATMRALFAQFNVWRLYADPAYWQSWIATWRKSFGEDRVIDWWTNRRTQMARALLGYHTAIATGLLTHDGDEDFDRHIGNTQRRDLRGMKDEQGRRMWLISKERSDSPKKIDLAAAGTLSWQARTDAIAAGLPAPVPQYQVLVFGGGRR